MAGGLMQLVAYGAQDVYLTGNPKVTFFQAVYRRHTNFAMENIEQTVNGTAADSGRVSVTVARNGDLVADMYVEMESKLSTSLSNDTAISNEWIAERAIKDVELSIGGQRIDKHYQTWWRLYSELYLDASKKVNYGKMTTGVSGKKVYLPLIFFFNRNPGLALPLIALQYHEVRLDFDLTSELDDYITPSSFKVYANYIYLDTEERRRFAQKGHEYLIEQVQHTGTDTLSAGSNQKRLSFNHPVKELVWCLSQSTKTMNNMWNFTTKNADVTIAPQVGSSLADSAVGVQVAADLGNCPRITATATTGAWDDDAASNMTDMKLVLNGQDRFKEQGSKYFNSVQPYNHHSGTPMPGVYSYSFALKPEEHQPTGTCNFSRIDNAQVAINAVSAATGAPVTLNMFAVNYNVLRIQSGMGGLAFSN